MVSLTPTEVLCNHLRRSIVLGLGSWNFDLVLVNQGHLYSFVLVIQSLCLFRLFIQSRSFQGVIRFPYSNSNYFVGSLSPLGWSTHGHSRIPLLHPDLVRVTAGFLRFLTSSEPILGRMILQSCLVRYFWSRRSSFGWQFRQSSGMHSLLSSI